MKAARIVTKRGRKTPNGYEAVTELRVGAKGTGKVIGAVRSWPWSASSSLLADRIMFEIVRSAEDAGYTVVEE